VPLNLIYQPGLRLGKRPCHAYSSCLAMAAAAKELGHGTHIDIVLGAQAHANLPRFVLAQEQGDLDPLQGHRIKVGTSTVMTLATGNSASNPSR
jgi:hypothetical protein